MAPRPPLGPHGAKRAKAVCYAELVLKLPIHRATRFLLVGPHYPENLGAAARAIKTMGFYQLGLVRPSRLATPDHPMAMKMAVKSLDVLEATKVFENLDEALVGSDWVVATTSRRGVSGVLPPRSVAERAVVLARQARRVTIVFGNEKSGLSRDELGAAEVLLRIPMAADQPSVNLAQATQLVAYELFREALDERERAAT
jgi:TrmH family RNA methyltransferase